MQGLLGRAALPVDGGARHRLGEAGGQDRVAGHVEGLLAALADTAEDDIVDRRRVEVVALDEGAEDFGGQVDGMVVPEPAVAAGQRRADGVDDDGGRDGCVRHRAPILPRAADNVRPSPTATYAPAMPWNGLLDVVVFAIGFFMVAATLGSAIRTVVLPRAIPAKLASLVFITVRRLFDLRLRRVESYERRDRLMAPYAPLSLFTLALVWMTIVLTGYSAMFWALREGSYREDFRSSGSALFTLGFEQPDTLPTTVLAFTEAAIGLTLLALLITYLPSLYSAFARREVEVALMEVRAGRPPSGVAILERYARINWIGGLPAIWERWERWFAEVEESHTSFPALVFFRSPQPDQSWVTAAGAVLDAAALFVVHRRGPRPRCQPVPPRRLPLPAPDRHLLRHLLRPRPRAGRPHLRRPRRVRRRLRPAGGRRHPGEGRPRPGVAGLRRVAGQLRQRARGPGRPGHGPVRAMVVGPLEHPVPGPGDPGAPEIASGHPRGRPSTGRYRRTRSQPGRRLLRAQQAVEAS